jgi:Putative Flp pilus-assembly TadE/G-like
MLRQKSCSLRKDETGSVLLIVAASMVFLLGISAIAIDMANLYMARAQTQRAADAAALAGAKAFVTTGCASGGCVPGGIQETLGRQQAQAAGGQNYVAGQPASIQDSDVTFSYPNYQEPQITVIVRGTVSTFFAKIFGIMSANVGATATAEAYNPAGGSTTTVSVSCLKPFLVPNCDPIHTSPGNAACNSSSGPGTGTGGGGASMGYFFDPASGAIVHPGVYPAGIIGMPWQLHTTAAPSQWYLVGFNGAPPSSGSALWNHIVKCTPTIFSCGDTLVTANGATAGPAMLGIEALINAAGAGLGQGQDSIDTTVGPPFPFTGGSSNQNTQLRSKLFYDYSETSSVVTVPVYSGGPLPPGGSVVGIVGYLQVFVTQAETFSVQAIDVVILNATPCGAAPGAGGGSNGSGVSSSGSPIPIRLIRTN